MTANPDLRAALGFVQPNVRAEFPGLRLLWLTVEAPRGPTPPAVARRIRAWSDRYWGTSVVAMRTQPIPRAYRVFYRQIGLDPDIERVPSEQAAVARLVQGRFVSQDVIRDALLLALLETSVPVWALDAARVDPAGLGIRTSEVGDRLVVADASRTYAQLFGEVDPTHWPGPRTRRLVLYTVGVDGVPMLHLEEALYVSVEALAGA
jgi:DNA/RNA-binding domain of Phe-tRNA-synthetase-like protein